jgi:hypothetical protein
MLVDVEITRGVDVEIEAAVPRDELEHVIEKSDSGRDSITPTPVELETERDRRFLGLPIDYAAPHSTSSSARMHAVV